MGRRSINTTKSGKFMNPTDQARKEARKKELKKNKKQRMLVRTAVLKGKDPVKLLEEMEIIDKMEYDSTNPPKLSEKVLKDKRKKLKETFERVVRLYEREDPEYCLVLKKEEKEYTIRRNVLIERYEQIKFTENVELANIPMPEMPSETPTAQIPLPGEIPLPGPSSLPEQQPKSILKKLSAFDHSESVVKRKRKPVGPPPGTPPDLSDSEAEVEVAAPVVTAATALLQSYYNQPPVPGVDVDKDEQKPRRIRFKDDSGARRSSRDDEPEESEEDLMKKFLRPKPAPTPLQLKMLKMAGQQLPAPAAGLQDDDDDDDDDDEKDNKSDESSDDSSDDDAGSKDVDLRKSDVLTVPAAVGAVPPGPPPGAPPGMSQTTPGPVPLMHLRPPLPRPTGPRHMMPPGPPPGRPRAMPPGPPPGLPPRGHLPRIPPGAPPGLPPRIMRPLQPGMIPLPNMPPPGMGGPPQANPNVLSAPPSIMKPPKQDEDNKNTATIEAKPQIKHQIGDVTKFMPTSLRVKRDTTKVKTSSKTTKKDETPSSVIARPAPAQVPASQTKDDVYDMFMREMEDFL